MATLRTTRELLENALVQTPDDLATHSAYADLLMEESDPRGEFIQIQLRLEQERLPQGERKRLCRRERELRELHQDQWLGVLAPYVHLERDSWTVAFRRGWCHRLHIPDLTVDMARQMRHAPELRLLQELINLDSAAEDSGEDFIPGDDVPDDDSFPCLHALVGSTVLTNVRHLQLGTLIEPYESPNVGHGTGDALVQLLAAMPRLEALLTNAYSLNVDELFAFPFANLKRLHVSRGFSYTFKTLAQNAHFATLEELLIQPNDNHIQVRGIDLDDIEELLRSPTFGNLRSFGVHAAMGDAFIATLVRLPILNQLERLDLQFNMLTDDGVQMLLAHPAIRRLKALNLERNQLSAEGIRAVLEVQPLARVHSQSNGSRRGHGADLHD